MPATDSASCAVTAAIRVRTSANAVCDAVWNQRVTTIPGGSTISATTPRRQSSRKRPPIAARSVSELTTSVVSPWLRTSEMRVDVARQPRDDPAGLLLREVAERERGEVVEEVAAQVEHDLLADAGEHQPRRRAEDPGRRADGDVEHDVDA